MPAKRRRVWSGRRISHAKRRRRPVTSVVPRSLQGSFRYSRPDFEKKFLDTTSNFVAGANILEKYNVNIIPQGDTESERIGRKITIRNIYLRGSAQLTTQTAANVSSVGFRVYILVDTQTNGAAFNTTDFLAASSILSFRNLDNQTRFKVLHDKVYTLTSGGAGQTGASTFNTLEGRRYFKFGKKCNIPIEFDSSAGTGVTATQTVNSIWVCIINTDTNTLNITTETRVRYTDF